MVLVDHKLVKATPTSHPPVILLMAVLRRPFSFGSLVVLDVVCAVSRGSNGYAQIDVRFPDKNDKSVQTR